MRGALRVERAASRVALPYRRPSGNEVDRHRLSPHIRVLEEILAQLRPEPARPAPLPRDGITSHQARAGMGDDDDVR
jgi:hypothetical protein